MATRQAAGGGRWVEVDPERLPRWLAGFHERNGPSTEQEGLALHTANQTATFVPPPGLSVASVDELVREGGQPRRIGLLLVRRGGYAVGVADGTALVSSKVDSRYVQSRTAAGGWSQQRFARRRVNQAGALVQAAADVAARLLLPASYVSLVTGGDRRLVDEVLDDPRLGPVRDRRSERFLDVPDPRQAVLEAAVRQARTVRIHVRD
jgi:hypothetical protein